MDDDELRMLIERGDPAGLRRALGVKPGLANRSIHWYLNQHNESDPLHYVSDCVFNNWLTNGTEAEIAEILLAHGATLDGNDRRESPLIGSVSLGAENVSTVLIQAGADLETTSVFGSRALHWAAWMGAPATVGLLLAKGASIEPKCSEFGATPLFWAAHGYGPHGPRKKTDQVAAARTLIDAGANIHTHNKEGISAIEMARRCEQSDMHALLQERSGKPG